MGNEDEPTQWTVFGSVGAALGAAVCCLGPFALVSLGVGGAWIGELSALEPYRPFFMVLAAGFLGVGFYRVYGSASTAAEPESCEEDCEVPKASRINRASLWIAAVVVAGLFAAPSLVAPGNTTEPAPEATATASSEGGARSGSSPEFQTDLRRVELKVDGMTCGGCVRTVTSTLEQVEGVTDASVTLKPPRATVEFDAEKTTVPQITKSTANVGYESTPTN